MGNVKILRLPTVLSMLGVSKPTIYLWIRKGEFPRPMKIGCRASGWLLSEVESWISERETARSAAEAA